MRGLKPITLIKHTAFCVWGLLIVMISTAGTAHAKLPQEVLKPYKAYSAALKSGDKMAAAKHAQKAWEAAERLIGDSKTTGDLAQNYADIVKYESMKKAGKAYLRAAELADTSTPEGVERKLTRLIAAAQAYTTTQEAIKKAAKPLATAKALITEKGLEGGTFDGEVKTISGLLKYARRYQNEAIELYDEAIAIFDGPKHDLISVYPYAVRLYKGDALAQQDKPIAAALEYQVVMQNMKGALDKDHPFIRKSFHKWLNMRGHIDNNKKNAEAEAAGVCKCWPYDEVRENSVLPILRVPPTMPPSARRSGRTIFKFDLDDAGKVINIEKVRATQTLFVRSARKSLTKWKYEPIEPGDDPSLRKGLVTTIRFKLVDESGRLIPEPED